MPLSLTGQMAHSHNLAPTRLQIPVVLQISSKCGLKVVKTSNCCGCPSWMVPLKTTIINEILMTSKGGTAATSRCRSTSRTPPRSWRTRLRRRSSTSSATWASGGRGSTCCRTPSPSSWPPATPQSGRYVHGMDFSYKHGHTAGIWQDEILSIFRTYETGSRC